MTLSRDDLNELARNPLKISVVGHTDPGKTSIVRTLTEVDDFGEVSPLPGATTRVSGQQYTIDGRVYMVVYDTPGLEVVGRILAESNRVKCADCRRLENELGRSQACDPKGHLLGRVRTLLNDRACDGYERTVLEHVVQSDVLLHVISCVAAPGPEAEVELRFLAAAGKPLIPVLNFVTSGIHRRQWPTFFNRNGNPIACEFDAHVRVPAYEKHLFKQVACVLEREPPKQRAFEHWSGQKLARWESAQTEAAATLAQLLLDAAAYRAVRTGVHPEVRSAAKGELQLAYQGRLRDREKDAHNTILRRYAHREGLSRSNDETVFKAGSEDDLFGDQIARHLGIGVLACAAAGAGAAVVIDLIFHGWTLGAAAAVGAVSGAITGAVAGGFYNVSYDKKRATLTVEPNRNTLRALYWRGVGFATACHFRGHAVEPRVTIDVKEGVLPTVSGVIVPAKDGPADREIFEAVERVVAKVGTFDTTDCHSRCRRSKSEQNAYEALHEEVRDRIKKVLNDLEAKYEAALRQRGDDLPAVVGSGGESGRVRR